MASEPPDYTTMSDPEFLAERRRIREQLAHAPGESATRLRLAALHAALDEEFDRRARAAWSRDATGPANPRSGGASQRDAPALPATRHQQLTSHATPNSSPATGESPMDEDLRKRLLAIEVLLEIPEDISDGLEAELYALRDKLRVIALS
jgi:hypothetical protein